MRINAEYLFKSYVVRDCSLVHSLSNRKYTMWIARDCSVALVSLPQDW